jgi:dihydropyrimidinase
MLTDCAHADLGHFADSRPIEAETVATERAIAMCRATRAPTYIVHLSSARALAACAAARAEGLPVFVETRPLYLHLTAERYREREGALYVAQPPLRAADDQAALWRGLADGSIDTIASDHAPWTRELKLDPKLNVAHCRSGVAELDTMLPLLFTEGVATGRLTMERFVALTSTNAAKLFGMYPRKGTIAVGSDADITVWETETGARRPIRDADLFSRARHSVYAGRELSAWPRATIRRGEVVFENGKVLGQPGSGRAIERGATLPPAAAPRAS